MLCYNCMREKGDAVVCPHCNAQSIPAPMPHHIRPGTLLGRRYTIGRVLGEGGFGITYIGRENVLGITVAIKEYYPYGFSNRNTAVNNTVSVISENKREFFEKGKTRFLREARTLARFQKEPGIVNVIDFIEENGTAYIVMEYLDGVNLSVWLKQNGVMQPEQAVQMLMPVMRALEKVHREGVIHRDISPDNIMVEKNGNLKLMDFGAARDFEGENRSMSVMLKQGYAPEEQYRRNGEQGPWTDVYGLCATIYRAITGTAPVESIGRTYRDTLRRPSECGVRISPALEETLMYGLAIHKEYRCPDMGDLISRFERALKGERTAPVPAAVPPQWNNAERDRFKTQPADKTQPVYPAAGNTPPVRQQYYQQPPVMPQQPQPQPQKQRSNTAVIVAVCVAAVVVIAAVILILTSINSKSDPASTSSSAPSAISSGADESEVSAVVSQMEQTEREITMPDMIGMTKQDAKERLAKLGLSVAKYEEVESSKVSEGRVHSQYPDEGSDVDEDTEIILYIAKTKPTSAPTKAPVIDSPAVSSSYLYCTATTYVTVHSSASTSSSSLRKIWSGQSVRYISKPSSSWYEIETGSVRGYVASAYFSTSYSAAKSGATLYCNNKITSADPLWLRSGPSKKDSKLDGIVGGESMTYLGVAVDKGDVQSNGYHAQWVYVRYGGRYGYVYDYYVYD